MSTYDERMREELAELVGRCERLSAFLDTDTYDDLSLVDRLLLHGQVQGMSIYAEYLNLRIEEFDEKNT